MKKVLLLALVALLATTGMVFAREQEEYPARDITDIGIAPGPMLHVEQPTFVFQVSAILLLASAALYSSGVLLAPQVVKLLRVPPALFMPIVAVLCLIGSYALELKIFNLYLMVPIGILAYYMGEL